MFVINAAMPIPSSKIYVPTRLVIGCEDQARYVETVLTNCGVDAELTEVQTPPERSDDEKRRAMELMALLFAPTGGTA